MGTEKLLIDNADGFVGAMTGVTLADVIQMNGHNRFTGCLTLEYGGRSGMIYFRNGEVIHAEQEDISGEAAFNRIMSWPSGNFTLQPKVTTAKSSINASLNHLLLESLRIMDEENKRRKEEAAVSGDRRVAPRNRGNVYGHLQRIPGVEHAVLLGKDGKLLDDDSFKGENLAGQAIYLAMIGNTIGASFALGEIKSVAVQGKRHQMLLFGSKNNYLGVAVSGESSLGGVESEIRKALTAKK